MKLLHYLYFLPWSIYRMASCSTWSHDPYRLPGALAQWNMFGKRPTATKRCIMCSTIIWTRTDSHLCNSFTCFHQYHTRRPK